MKKEMKNIRMKKEIEKERECTEEANKKRTRMPCVAMKKKKAKR